MNEFIIPKKPNSCPRPDCQSANIRNLPNGNWECGQCGTVITQEDSNFAQSILPEKSQRSNAMMNLLYRLTQKSSLNSEDDDKKDC